MAEYLTYSEGGYDYEFVDTPSDNLVCKICHFPSREPHLTVCCGHTFCKSCVGNAKKSRALSEACPVCRTDRYTTVPNKQNERDVLSLHVLCTNTKRGCDWIGEVNDITNHLTNSSGCKFEDVSCPSSCGKKLERQHLSYHVEECPRRLINCQYCDIEGEYQFIEGQSHQQHCNRFPVSCPNKCDKGNLPREDLKEHRKVCPLEVVHCQYHDVGCEAKVVRKDLVKHDEEKANKHLLLMKSILIDTQKCLREAQTKLSDTVMKLDDTQNKLTDTQSKLADTQSKLADTKERLGDTQSKLSATQNKLGDTELNLTYTNLRTIAKIEDKLAGTEDRLVLAEENIDSNHTEISDEISDLEDKFQEEKDTVKDRIDELEVILKQKTKLIDILIGQWTIEIHTRAAKLSSCNQLLPVIVKVTDVIKEMAMKNDVYSKPFYTHHQGYKMQLYVVPGGCGLSEGQFMSVYLCIMDGPFDHQLKWQLRGTFEVTLLNQLHDGMHHSVSYRIHAKRGQSRPFWYSDNFISRDKLREISAFWQYVKDDCVFFKVCEL